MIHVKLVAQRCGLQKSVLSSKGRLNCAHSQLLQQIIITAESVLLENSRCLGAQGIAVVLSCLSQSQLIPCVFLSV